MNLVWLVLVVLGSLSAHAGGNRGKSSIPPGIFPGGFPIFYEDNKQPPANLRPPNLRVQRREADSSERDVINYKSDLEEPKIVNTRPNYTEDGRLMPKIRPQGRATDRHEDFVPQRLYTQIRRTDTVKHLPKSAALAEAATYEEIVNAPRLREILSHKKIQQVYEEEGYEDAGYDHGGYNHQGALYEGKEKGSEKRSADSGPESADLVEVVVDNSQKESTTPAGGIKWKRYRSESQTRRMSWDEQDGNSQGDGPEEVTEPFVKGKEEIATTATPTIRNPQMKPLGTKSIASKAESTETMEERSADDLEKSASGETIEASESQSHSEIQSDAIGRSLEPRVVNDPRPKGSGSVTFPGRHTRRQYAIGRPMDVYVQESVGMGIRRPMFSVPVHTNVHHYVPYMPPFPSYYSDTPGAYTAPLISQRVPAIQTPTIALSPPTTPAPPITLPSQSSESEPMKFLNAAGTLNAYANLLQEAAALSSRPAIPAEDGQKLADVIQPRFNSTFDVDTSPSTRNEKRGNRTTAGRPHPKPSRHPSTNFRGKLYNNFTRVGSNYPVERRPYNKNTAEFKNPSPHTRHPSLPRDSSEQGDSSHDQSTQILAINSGLARPLPRRQDPVKYIEQLTVAHYHNTGSVPISPPSVQNERLKELARQLNAHNEDYSGRIVQPPKIRRKRGLAYDAKKYPFYSPSVGVNKHSALRYASNPRHMPKKSAGGMEFYESRDRLVRCEEPKPPEDIIPQQEEDGEWNKKPVPKDLPRIKGIGDAITCLKIKYWGRNPLDNPFFAESSPKEPRMNNPEENDGGSIARHSRRTRSTQEKNKRLMIVPPRNDNSSNNGQKHQNYTDSEKIRSSNNYGSFPYKNHKPADAVVSPSVHQIRANSPYRYYSQHDDSYFPVRESVDSGQDNEGDDTKRHKYYLHKTKHKVVYKKKRVRPPYHHHHHGIRRPFPVSIYSIIGASNQQPVYLRPVAAYAAGNTGIIPGISPGYHLAPAKNSDNFVSDSNNVLNTVNNNQPVPPTRWYIVRPGEYTENKDIASDNKPSASSSFWSYMNPLRWWFPSYFDQRRNEPRYRRRRSSEQELFNRILAKTNLSAVEARVFESYRTGAPDASRLAKAETTTSSPISIQELKSRLNLSADRQQKPASSKLSRLTGGFISRHNFSGTTPSHTYSLNTPAYGADQKLGTDVQSTTPMLPPSATSTKSTTAKPKVSFPRTKTPSKRRPLTTKKKPKSDIRSVLTSTTTTTTTPPSTTTRMYKPKRVINKKKFDRRVPLDAFTVLKRAKQPPTSGSPFDSVESESGSESREGEEPRRLQQVEHRRVTKEEVYKTSYVPEESRDTRRNVEESIERYSISSSEASPPMDGSEATTMSLASQERAKGDQDHTLTYMVNPVTGVGSWGEQPRRTNWKPKKRYPKRHLEDSFSSTGYHQPALYSYPALESADAELEATASMARNKKLHSREEHLNNGDYVARLLSQVSPGGDADPDLKSRESIEKYIPNLSSADSQSIDDRSQSVDDGSRSEESTAAPFKSSPKFIMDPGKRKYFYVKL